MARNRTFRTFPSYAPNVIIQSRHSKLTDNKYTDNKLVRVSIHHFDTFYSGNMIFGTKVHLDNTYTLAILKWFGKILIPSNPP